ncbi:MAG: YtxH domain-containing protein [Candidatus Omnitrophica bacterium]|nr:YtxH domain-containing protein [Candidatus Omnitrophota bacterium]
MKQIRRKGMAKAAGAFALGAAAGSIITLLSAPASGKVMRRRIGLKMRAVRNDAARKVALARKQLAKKAGVLRDAAAQRLGHTREWLVERVTSGNGKHPAHHRAAH